MDGIIEAGEWAEEMLEDVKFEKEELQLNLLSIQDLTCIVRFGTSMNRWRCWKGGMEMGELAPNFR